MRPTLKRIFLWSFIGLAVSLTLLFCLVFAGSQRTILQSAENFRKVIAKEVAQRVTNYLDEAPKTVMHFEQDMHYGIVNPRDAKSILQEWVQSRGKTHPIYVVVESSGPAHAPSFIVEVQVEGLDSMQGEGTSKRLAEQVAAGRLLEVISNHD